MSCISSCIDSSCYIFIISRFKSSCIFITYWCINIFIHINPHFCYISLYIRCKAHNVKICLCLHKIILLPFRCALHLLYIMLYKLLYYPMCVSVYVTAHINCYWKTSYMCWVCFYIYGKCCLCAAKSTRSYS